MKKEILRDLKEAMEASGVKCDEWGEEVKTMVEKYTKALKKEEVSEEKGLD